MIDATKARELMPSVQRSRYPRKKRIDEIFDSIEQAARNDLDTLFIYIYKYEEELIISTLKDNGFEVEYIPGSMQWNADTDDVRFKYKISW